MAETPACPRCGYDQRGVIDSWTQSCPLMGVCSECGLEFQWRDLLDPRFRVKPMLFEDAQSRFVASFFYTLWWMLRPGSFWKWVRLEDEINIYRLGIFACLSPFFLALATLVVMIPIAFSWGVFVWLGSDWVSPWDFMSLTLFAHSWEYFPELYVPVVCVMAATAIAPGFLSIFGDSMRLARVRRAHLLRVWVYSLICVPVAYSMLAVSAMLDWNARGSATGLSFLSLELLLGRPRPTLLPAIGASLGFQTLVIRRAVVSYLRLPSAWGVALCVGAITAVLIAVFSTLAILLVLRGYR